MAVGKREWVERMCGGPSSSSSGSGRSSKGDAQDPTSSSVWVGIEDRGVVGVLGMKDTLRPDAKGTIGRLRELGMR